MPRYWSDEQLDAITPPQVLDGRGRAFLRVLDSFCADRPVAAFHIRNAYDCPSEALPALIAEYSLEEYIEPGLPEEVVRRIIASTWALKTYKGFDKGVRLGLSLLGMQADIEHWHQAEPKRAPNTHIITFYVGQQLFEDGSAAFGSGEISAAKRMVDATKRWSQGTELRVGARKTAPLFCGAAATTHVFAVARAQRPEIPILTVNARQAAIATSIVHATAPAQRR
ncbi:phage tail protein I [Roseobacteraceae bacterium NS-SX3]